MDRLALEYFLDRIDPGIPSPADRSSQWPCLRCWLLSLPDCSWHFHDSFRFHDDIPVSDLLADDACSGLLNWSGQRLLVHPQCGNPPTILYNSQSTCERNCSIWQFLGRNHISHCVPTPVSQDRLPLGDKSAWIHCPGHSWLQLLCNAS
jgi:hypothetical protein